jgi:hypothetical protein
MSDHGKAERGVRGYRVEARPESFGAFLEARMPGGAWDSEITNGCRGVVRVRYALPRGPEYAFDFDVPGHVVHPGNQLGLGALREFGAAGSPAPAGAPPR